MEVNRHNDFLTQIRIIIEHIPRSRWMILPFLTRTKPPPSINGLQQFSKVTCSCDDTILHLLEVNGLVKLSYSKVTDVLTRITYSKDEAKWNEVCTNGICTIDLATYGTYKYICLYAPKSSSHRKHSVSDVHTGNIVYSQLAMSSRKRMRLGKEAMELTPNRSPLVNIDNTLPAVDQNLNGATNSLPDVVPAIKNDLDTEGERSDGRLEAVAALEHDLDAEAEKLEDECEGSEDGSDDVEEDAGRNEPTRLNLKYPIMSKLGLLPVSSPNFAELLTEVLLYWWENEKDTPDDVILIPCRNHVNIQMIPLRQSISQRHQKKNMRKMLGHVGRRYCVRCATNDWCVSTSNAVFSQ